MKNKYKDCCSRPFCESRKYQDCEIIKFNFSTYLGFNGTQLKCVENNSFFLGFVSFTTSDSAHSAIQVVLSKPFLKDLQT